ncbi:basic secretory protein-like protein [Pedobacter hartonius]|uniref:Peptidase n=1 Tax=Pedobacter hartonius TaxID=425514 RepID=A0A1H3YSY7_9SPHI|nr:basic secretory protein-like protein [Pedobacter hartonius]SEA14527.1 Peptidase [Pedobacter hartonius]
MRQQFIFTIFAMLLVGTLSGETRDASLKAQTPADTIRKEGYALIFNSNDPNLVPAVKQKLIDTYFQVYPVLVKTFNKKATKNVVFIVDTAYKYVAESSGGEVKFSAGYLKAHPYDTDVVTHETMHIVQGYGDSTGPGWLTEGIADYVRYAYGIDNAGSKWALPDYNAKQNYTNSYRITGRFLLWIEQHVKKGTVKMMDASLRTHTYNDGTWKELTGKTLDELWAVYASSPAVTV